MDSYQHTIQTWNKIADLYEKRFMDMDLYNESYDQFCKLLSDSKAVILEVGCGPGNISHYLLKKNPAYVITGIDASAEMVKLARKNNPTATFRVMDARAINTLDGNYDAVVLGFIIPYLSAKDCSKLFTNIHELLAEKGMLYLSFVPGNYSRSGYQMGSSGDRLYFYYHEAKQIQRNLEQLGFEIVIRNKVNYKKTDGTHEIHSIWIARKTDLQTR